MEITIGVKLLVKEVKLVDKDNIVNRAGNSSKVNRVKS